MLEVGSLNLTFLIIAIIAPIGAFDTHYYHQYKFKLHEREQSRSEVYTHVFRHFLLGITLPILATYKPGGYFYWLFGGLFFLDFINNIVDVYLEDESRKDLGGHHNNHHHSSNSKA